MVDVNSADEDKSRKTRFKGITFQPLKRFFGKRMMKPLQSKPNSSSRDNERDLLESSSLSKSSPPSVKTEDQQQKNLGSLLSRQSNGKDDIGGPPIDGGIMTKNASASTQGRDLQPKY